MHDRRRDTKISIITTLVLTLLISTGVTVYIVANKYDLKGKLSIQTSNIDQELDFDPSELKELSPLEEVDSNDEDLQEDSRWNAVSDHIDEKLQKEIEYFPASYLAVGHRGGNKISVFNVGTWQAVSGILPLDREPYGLVFSPSGKWLAAAHSHGSNLRVYETEGWLVVDTPNLAFNNVSFGWSAAFSPDEELLAVGADTLFLIRTQNWSVVDNLPNMDRGASVYRVDFSSDGEYLAFTYKNEARVLKISDLSLQTVYTWHGSTTLGVIQVEFSPDGRFLAVGHYGETNGKDKYLTILRTNDWSQVGSFYLDGTVNCLNFSPDGKFLAVGHQYGRGLTIFNVHDWTTLRGVPAPLGTSPRAVSFSKDGKYLVATHAAVQIRGHGPELIGKSVTIYQTLNWSIDRTFPELYGATSESAAFSP